MRLDCNGSFYRRWTAFIRINRMLRIHDAMLGDAVLCDVMVNGAPRTVRKRRTTLVQSLQEVFQSAA